MLTNGLCWLVKNFACAMFALALIFIVLHKLINRKVPESEIIYRWMTVFVLGFAGIYAFIMPVFFPQMAATEFGGLMGLMPMQMAFGYLAFGILGILSFKASYGFRLATVIGSTCWLWGMMGWSIYTKIGQQPFTVSDLAVWDLLALFLPLILIICIVKLKPRK